MPNELRIDFFDLPADVHHCTSFVDGDWIVFRCPLCQQYERRINFATGQMKAKGNFSEIRHTGAITGQKENLSGLELNKTNEN